MHPYAGHKQQAVGKRRVKTLLRTGGYHGEDLVQAAGKLKHKIASHEAEERHSGEYAQGGRIDKRARGGRAGKLTPSKHKPHISINLHSHPAAPSPGGGMGMAAAPLPPPGGGLPPPMPGGGMPPPMKRGGRTGSEYISGVSAPENLKKWKSYAGEGTVKYARGGRTESLQSLPGGGEANKLASIPDSPGGNKVGVHADPHLNSDRRAWADKLGGTDRTRSVGKMRSGKHFGTTTGPGQISAARAQKAGYP